MANYASLEAAIQAAVYENNTNDITGTAMQTALLQMVSAMGKAGMLCCGVCDGSTVPPANPDSNLFYIAPTGTYSNFGGLTVAAGEWAIFIYSGGWTKQSVPVASIVNDLTTGGSTKALSAEMGKTLNQTDQDTHFVIVGGKGYVKTETAVDLAAATEYDPGWIQNVGGHAFYNPTANRKFKVFAVPAGSDNIRIVMAAGKTTKLAYMTSSSVTVNQNLPTCVGEDAVVDVLSGENVFYIPSDCTYIALGTYASGDLSPLEISTQSYTLVKRGKGILGEIEDLQTTLTNPEGIDLADGTEYAGWIVTQSSKVYYNLTTYPTRKFVIAAMPTGKERLDIVMPSGKTTKLAFLKSATATANAYLDACLGETGVRNVNSGLNTYDIPTDCTYIAVGTYASGSVAPVSITAYTQIDNLIAELQDAVVADLPKLQNNLLNSYGETISKFTTEKLAHISNVDFANGYFYIPYVADESNWQESYSISTNFIRLAVVPLCDLTKTQWYDVAKDGDVIGGVTIQSSVTSPHDPTVKVLNGYAYILFRATISGQAVEVCRRFNISTMSLENSLTILTLDGVDFDPAAVVAGYNSKAGASIASIDPYSMDFNSQIVLASDGYYYGGVGGVANGFYGIIVKSSDLLNWTTVTAKDWLQNTAAGEVNLVEMGAGMFLVAFRDQTNHTLLATWDSVNNNWPNNDTYYQVPGSVTARPCPFVWKGTTYVAMNMTGTDRTLPVYGTAIRQNLGVYKVNDYNDLTEVAFLHRDCSIQYPALIVANEDKLWMSFSTDTRHISAAQGRSNLEFKEMTYILK